MQHFAYIWRLLAHSGDFYLQLTISAVLLTVGAFSLAILAGLLTVRVSLLTLGKCV